MPAASTSSSDSLPPALPQGTKELLRSLKKAVGADAVQLVSFFGEPHLLADDAPSEEISANLLRTAGDVPGAAAGASCLANTYRFGDQLVHLIARSAGKIGWILVWLRLKEGQSVDSVQEALALGVRSLDSSPKSPLFLTGNWQEFDAVVRSANRQQTLCEKIAKHFGCKTVFLVKKGWFFWKIVAANGSLPGRNSRLAHAVLQGVKARDGAAEASILEEIARCVSSAQAKVFSLGNQFALVVAGEDTPSFTTDFLWSLRLSLLAVREPFFGGGPGATEKQPGASRRKTVYFLIGFLVFLAVMAFPVRVPVRSEVLLEPSLRRFVVAPFQGIIRTVGVRSGDVVSAGDLLVELDGREILERLSDVEARLSMTILQNASEMESANYSEAALRALDARSLEHERDLLLYRKENLRLVAPQHGVVVAGDLERSEGAAVELGKRLLEVAPLETLVAEIAVDERDIALVEVGQEVKIQLRALPGTPFVSKVLRVSPKAETRDEKNVFIVEAELPNPGDLLRPGMKGKAVIYGGQAPLAWALVRRPWQMVLRWTFR